MDVTALRSRRVFPSLMPFFQLLVFLISSLLVTQSYAQNEPTWRLNLKQADIGAFVEQVADITGFNIIVDPQVRGKVTVLSSTPMNAAEIYDLFLSVLEVHGFTAISGEDAIKVVQQVNAKESPEALDRFARPPSGQLMTEVIPVENTRATELAQHLRPLVAKYGHLAGVPTANALIISDRRSNIARIRRLIKSLDVPSGFEVEVIQLHEAWVGDLAPVLSKLGPIAAGGAEQANQAQVTADERSNRLIIYGDQKFRDSMYKIVRKLDQPSATQGDIRVVRLKHADADNLTKILNTVASQKAGDASGQPDDGFSVIADNDLNALVIRGKPAIMQKAKSIIAQLDVRRAQVMIEAAIVEISDETGESAGVQVVAGEQSGGRVTGAGTNLTSSSGMLGLNSVIGALVGDTLPQLASGLTVGVTEVNQSGITWGVLIQALNTSAAANLLSTPSLITLDNQESEIIVGQNVPFRTGQSTVSGDGTTNPFTTIERRDIGLTLNVTPTISEDGLVRLEVEQTTENLARTNIEGASDLITNKRSIKTTVLADNQETIVLGGLTRDDLQVTTSKIPLLGDLPGIGKLFSSETKQWVKRDLVVFLRPSIMRDQADTAEITDDTFDDFYDIDLSTREKLNLSEKQQPLTTDHLFVPIN